MATKTTTLLVDDLDATELGEDGTTVPFAIDGTEYQIDLSTEHAAEFRAVFAPYVNAARKTPSRRGPASRSTSTTSPSGDAAERKAARAWLREQGHKVGDRGRISAELMELYRNK